MAHVMVLMSKFVRHVMSHVMLGRWRARPVQVFPDGLRCSTANSRTRDRALTRLHVAGQETEDVDNVDNIWFKLASCTWIIPWSPHWTWPFADDDF